MEEICWVGLCLYIQLAEAAGDIYPCSYTAGAQIVLPDLVLTSSRVYVSVFSFDLQLWTHVENSYEYCVSRRYKVYDPIYYQKEHSERRRIKERETSEWFMALLSAKERWNFSIKIECPVNFMIIIGHRLTSHSFWRNPLSAAERKSITS